MSIVKFAFRGVVLYSLTLVACSGQYKMHVSYLIYPSQGAKVLSPCLGLIDKATQVLETDVICEKDVKMAPSELKDGVMDVTVQNADPRDLWAGKVEDQKHAFFPLLLQDGVIYLPYDDQFLTPDESPDGDWLLKAKFDVVNPRKFDGANVSFQSFSPQLTSATPGNGQ